MAKSSITYPNQSAGVTNYNIVFTGPDPGYLNKAHVILFRDQVEQVGGFTWLTANTVQLDVATTAGEDIMFRRITPKDQPIVDYEIDNVLTDTDLDYGILQMLYIVHEIQDGYIDLGAAGYVDANNKKIVNVAAGTEDTDGVNKGQMDSTYSGWETTFTALKVAAEAAKTSAETAETNAVSAKDEAETARDIAVSSKNAAEAAQVAAETAQGLAETAQTGAETAETNAETAQAGAEAAEVTAGKWAANPEDVVIETGKYSALHYAAKAEAIEQNISPKHAYDQPTAPTGSDNWDDGWRVGSIWIHNEGGGVYTPYRCTNDGLAGDPPAGDATWVQSVLAAGEISNVDWNNLINVPTNGFDIVELAAGITPAETGKAYVRKVKDETTWTINLPTNPAHGMGFIVHDVTGSAYTNSVNVVRTNGDHKFNNLSVPLIRCDVSYAAFRFEYNTTLGWLMT